jgi:phenylacetate-coenzyme A ligase PaaK-like adenylate-forming protein
MQTYIALAAIGLLARCEVSPADIVQISTSARATLGNICAALAYERIGTLWYQTGLIEPAQALALLAERHDLPGKKQQTSYLNTYASYLGQLVEYGMAAGYGPANFGLERISVGGEIVTAGLKARAQHLFGPVHFSEGYAMTETWPTTGILCSQGHLHFEISQALVEVLDPHTGRVTEGGSAGTLVITPLPPYRETTLLLRYDTQDVVRAVAGQLTCELRHLPATGKLLGKLRLSVRHDEGWTYPYEVLEALETLDAVPLPARCGFWAVPHGVAVEVVVRLPTPGVRRQVEEALAAQGVPLQELYLVRDPHELRQPLPLRCDLRELTFSPPSQQLDILQAT